MHKQTDKQNEVKQYKCICIQGLAIILQRVKRPSVTIKQGKHIWYTIHVTYLFSLVLLLSYLNLYYLDWQEELCLLSCCLQSYSSLMIRWLLYADCVLLVLHYELCLQVFTLKSLHLYLQGEGGKECDKDEFFVDLDNNLGNCFFLLLATGDTQFTK